MEEDTAATPATETRQKEKTGGGEGGTTGSSPIAMSRMLAPGNLDVYLSARPITKTFHKRNLFYVAVKALPQPTPNEHGQVPNVANALPWRSPFMYMNMNEYLNMTHHSMKYRYKSCKIEFSNFMAHTGTLASSPTAHINFAYNGVMGYAGLVSGQVVGPHILSFGGGGQATHQDVHDNFSASYRERVYSPWPTSLDLFPQCKDILGGSVSGGTGTGVTSRVTYFDPIDTAFMELGKLPITVFQRQMTERRWRNGRKATRMMGFLQKTNDFPQHNCEAMYGGARAVPLATSNTAVTNGRYPNESGMDMRSVNADMASFANNGTMDATFWAGGIFDDIDPDVHSQFSAFGREPSDAQMANVTLRNPLDTFYFGFLIPNTTEDDPHVYMAFAVETTLEVEMVPWSDVNNDYQFRNRLFHYSTGATTEMDDGSAFLRDWQIRAANNSSLSGPINRVGYRQLQQAPVTINSMSGGKEQDTPVILPQTLHANLNSGGAAAYTPTVPWTEYSAFGYPSFHLY